MKNAVTLSGIIARHVNKARGKAIDKAPVELKQVFYRGAGSSLMADMPRRPAKRIQEYLTVKRLARDYQVQGLSELSHAPFEVLELLIDRPKRSKWVTVESPSESSLVPDFSGDANMQLAPYRIVDGRKVWLP
jgi:hypothetical protein